MADYVIKVDYADLEKAATDFNTKLSDVKNITSKMMQTIKGTGVSWTGAAANQYIKKFEGLEDEITAIHKMIGEHVSDLQEMAKQYKAAEDNNINLASNLNAQVF